MTSHLYENQIIWEKQHASELWFMLALIGGIGLFELIITKYISSCLIPTKEN